MNSYYSWYSNSTYSGSKLTIEYWGKTNIVTRLKENGVLDSLNEAHQSQGGAFTDANHVTFYEGSGGLGGGYGYEITGVRK